MLLTAEGGRVSVVEGFGKFSVCSVWRVVTGRGGDLFLSLLVAGRLTVIGLVCGFVCYLNTACGGAPCLSAGHVLVYNLL